MRILYSPSSGEFYPWSLNSGGVTWRIFGAGKGFNNVRIGDLPSFSLTMCGYNRKELEEHANRFAKKLLRHNRIENINLDANFNRREKYLFEYTILIDNQTLIQQSLTNLEIKTIINNFDHSINPFWVMPNGESIRVIDSDLVNNDIWTLRNENQHIDSTKISFSSIARFTKQKVSASIHKEDQQYIQKITFDYTGSERSGQQYLEDVIQEMKKELPHGYSIMQGGLNFQKDTKNQNRLFFLIIGIIFFICAIMFESYKQAFVVILLIPISFIGTFLTFYWFDFPFDQGGYISFILLSGIVVNGIILIVNDFNLLKKRYYDRTSLELYIEAFSYKILPIILTILSTSLGLIPFLVHGSEEVFWFSLAVGTIGGLIFSIFVIIFFIPLFFIDNTSLSNVLEDV